MIIHYPAAANEGTLGGLRTGLPSRQLAKDITLYQASASKRITLQLHNQVLLRSRAETVSFGDECSVCSFRYAFATGVTSYSLLI